MTRFPLLVFVAALAVAGLCSTVEVVNSAFNEIKDEKQPVGWTCTRDFRADRGVGHNGSAGLYYSSCDTNVGQNVASQDLTPEIGVPYRFSCLVRTEGFKAPGRNGIGIGIEWVDANGKWLGGGYNQHPFAVANSEWTQLGGSTREIPKEAKSMRVIVFVRPGCTGKAFFDNITVEPLERDPVAFVFSNAYRDLAVEGSVRFHAALFPPKGETVRDLKAVFKFTGADGRPLTRRGEVSADGRGATLSLSVSDLAMGTNAVACELTGRSGKRLGRATVDFVRAEKMPERRVWIDAHRRCIVDGKPFFPLGMYWAKVEADKLETYAKGPFNSLVTYSWISDEAMDLCQAKGLKVVPNYSTRMLNSEWSRFKKYTTREQIDMDLRGEINRLKDHPALLGWYVGDECPASEIAERTHMYRLFRELDPDHPTYVVMDRTFDLRQFIPICDVFGIDPYPICNPFSATMKIGSVTDIAREADSETFGDVPYWNVPQAFDWGLYRSGYAAVANQEATHAPTDEELRNMCWQHIAAGANGLTLYSYFDYYKRPESFEENWSRTCRIAQEVRAFIPVLLSADPAPTVSGAPSTMPVRTWMHRGQLYVLAVNRHNTAMSTRLRISTGGWRTLARGIGENAKLAGSDRIELELPPLGVSLMRLSR